MLIVLDTNCLIDATNEGSQAFGALQKLLQTGAGHTITLAISRHSIHELERKPDDALALVARLQVLPYYPVGTIDELIGTIDELAGTFDDIRVNHERMETLKGLANAGTDIHDRGALVDAIMAGAAAFVTSDKALASIGPSDRIRLRTGVSVLTPQQLTAFLGD